MFARVRRVGSVRSSWRLFWALASTVSMFVACASGATPSTDEPTEAGEGGGEGEGEGEGEGGAAGDGPGGASANGGSGAMSSAGGTGGTGGTGTKGGASGAGAPTGGFPQPGAGGSGAAGAGAAGTGAGGGAAGTSASTGGSSGSGPPPAPGTLGAPCSSSDECSSKTCADVGFSKFPSKVCVAACETGVKCPAGFHCAPVQGFGPACIADRDSACAGCVVDGDCKNQGDRCLTTELGEKYCAQDCSFDGLCPGDLSCKAPPGLPAGVKVCTPPPAGCPCAANRDQHQRSCSKTNGALTCAGTETCDAAKGQYVGCTAGDPQPETCNTKDDDCDGKVDNVPGATCACNGQSCSLQCTKGFVKYPTDLPDSQGCPCAVDQGEPQAGATCGAALKLSKISDGGGATKTEVTGTLSADDDVDWYKIDVADAAEPGKNSLHVRVTFTSNPDNEFAFKMLRGAKCDQEAAAPPITSYDFCVNFKSDDGKIGLATCGEAPNIPHCADLSQPYAIGVRRAASVKKKTCAPYKLLIEAAAGPCDKSSFDANCKEG